jgi:hypothetical protein
MKIRLLILACLLILLENTACTGAKGKHFDISLEGPWILYVDHDIASWPVLIAIAPNSHSVDNWLHEPPVVSAGDGFLLADFSEQQEMVGHTYCLTLDDKCAPKGAKALKSTHYPDAEPLEVAMPSGHKQWVDAVKNQHATALILPMPDSYSSDGVWPMRFAKKYSSDPTNYGKSEQHSIGVQLHYKNGPANFDLSLCDSSDVRQCGQSVSTNDKNTFILNSGTLRIAMKAPVYTSACDPHVRRIYPQMMAILGAKGNEGKQVIDPAHGVKGDGKSGAFDEDLPAGSYLCLAHDAQSPDCDKTVGGVTTRCDDPPPPAVARVQTYSSWLETLRNLRNAIEKLNPDDRKQDLAQIAGAIADEDLKYPRISKLDLLEDSIQPLIAASYTQLQIKVAKKSENHSVANLGLVAPLAAVAKYEKEFLDDGSLTKSGNDCKAMVMQAK